MVNSQCLSCVNVFVVIRLIWRHTWKTISHPVIQQYWQLREGERINLLCLHLCPRYLLSNYLSMADRRRVDCTSFINNVHFYKYPPIEALWAESTGTVETCQSLFCLSLSGIQGMLCTPCTWRRNMNLPDTLQQKYNDASQIVCFLTWIQGNQANQFKINISLSY